MTCRGGRALNPPLAGMDALSVFMGQIFALLMIALVALVFWRILPWKIQFWKKEDPPAATPEPPPEPEPQAKEEVVAAENYWNGNWSYIGGKYKEIKISSYRAVFCYKYYPKGKFSHLNKKDAAHRDMILAFKQGENYTAVELLCDFIRGHFYRSALRNYVLCVIPASTREKNERRFKDFCEKVSAECGIDNGFDAVVRVTDRGDSRTEKPSNTLEGVRIDASRVKGKKVILFDDITTRGESFVQMADELMHCGAKDVFGFFLGKTVFE